ncbi:hypothetical protein CHUAL_002016 [Chamberlinius hualienensis]
MPNEMALFMKQQSLPSSYSSPNFSMQNYVNDMESNFTTKNMLLEQRRCNRWNLDLTSSLTSNDQTKLSLGKRPLVSFYSTGKLAIDNVKCVNERHSSNETLVRQELVVMDKLNYEYNREQKCLLEFKDKIHELEEEYNDIVTKQKEKEKRLKERVQKLKKRFQVVIRFHSYLTKSIDHKTPTN